MGRKNPPMENFTRKAEEGTEMRNCRFASGQWGWSRLDFKKKGRKKIVTLKNQRGNFFKIGQKPAADSRGQQRKRKGKGGGGKRAN